jgi:hypothetical protein
MSTAEIFLATFIGCLFALFAYNFGREVIGGLIWRWKFGGPDIASVSPIGPESDFAKMMDADQEMRLMALDLTDDPAFDKEGVREKVIEAARAWRRVVPEENAVRMRQMTRNPWRSRIVQ